MAVKLQDVMVALKARGWGFGSRHGYAFTLNKRTGKPRKTDNLNRWVEHGSIRISDLNKIRNSSYEVEQAAARVEAVALGKPDPGAEKPPVDIEALVAQRVAEHLAKIGIGGDEIQVLKRIQEAQEPPAPPVKRKPGRPRKHPLPEAPASK